MSRPGRRGPGKGLDWALGAAATRAFRSVRSGASPLWLAVALLAALWRRARARRGRPEVVYSARLAPGEAVQVAAQAAPPKARRREPR